MKKILFVSILINILFFFFVFLLKIKKEKITGKKEGDKA